jgi:tRNA threonylcarbamoyladenosine biosynthesis protein TsaB
MLILSLDTCNARGSAALLRDGSVLQCAVHETEEEYSVWLLNAVERILRAESVAWKDIDVFAVVTGPGSFTGLRVGLTTAKGLAEVYGKKIAAVPRLEAIASMALATGEWVAVAVEGGRGEIYCALYRREGGELKREGQECVLAAEEFLSRVARAAPAGGVAWCTPGTERIAALEGWAERAALGDKLGSAAVALAPAVGKMGYALARAGKLVDALALDANYIRRPDAERFWGEARAGSHAR